MSYWARTTIVPLMVLAALKPLARNPKGVGIHELFLQDRRRIGMTPRNAPHQKRRLVRRCSACFDIDAARGRAAVSQDDCASARSIAALAFTEERLNGEDGMGAIYPPMANIVMMYDALGNRPDFPPRAITRTGIDKLLVIGERRGLLPALRLAGVGHRADLPTRCWKPAARRRARKIASRASTG